MRLEESPFYLLRRPESSRYWCRDEPNAIYVREEISCGIDPGHRRIGRFFSEPSLVIPHRPVPDVLFAWGPGCFIQEGALAILESVKLTGFWTSPAKAIIANTGEPVSIRRLGVKGWGGIVSPESGIYRDEYCPDCKFSHWTKLTNPDALINPEAWDGSDFFIIWPLPGFFFVTERVVQTFRDKKLTGARFVKSFPVEGMSIGYSPQRLSQSMPEERAREIWSGAKDALDF